MHSRGKYNYLARGRYKHVNKSKRTQPACDSLLDSKIESSHGNTTIDKNIWKLYFTSAENPVILEVPDKIKCIKNFVLKHMSMFDKEKIDATHSISLNLQLLLADSDFIEKWPMFNTDLFEKPNVILSLLEYCFHEVLKCHMKIKVRINNHQPIVPLSSLKVNYYGKLVTVKGTVIRVGSVGSLCTAVSFRCLSCDNIMTLPQEQGIFNSPTSCQSCKKGAKFEPLLLSQNTKTVDHQIAKIQEIQSQSGSGSIPRSVEVELQNDLVGTVSPGDVISVTGIVQVKGENKNEDGKKSARLLQMYIEAVSVHSMRNLNNPAISYTVKDYYAIQEIHACEDVFRLLVHSLCPGIFGHEIVKAGLILGLMGGTESECGPRPHPHVLIVGDPGLGKSQMLQAAANAAPRGVYVCGAASSSGGLTVSLGREPGGQMALDAGALVLADNGVCCIDELDKMVAHHGSLLEAMELRRVSVAKGGVVCGLPARATLLAAANPARGLYDRSKTVVENLKLNSALLSRFDLVFILQDKPNEKIDAMLSEHVLALHSGSSGKSENNVFIKDNRKDLSLNERLKLKPGETIDSLPLVLLRKYIAYAKRYVHPKLSKEAALALQEFYLKLRHNQCDVLGDGTPVTTRQLEACIRLAQARARVDLREEVSMQDVTDVINIMKHSLVDTFSDECGNIQLSRSIHGSGVSSRNKLKIFIEALMKKCQQLGKDIFSKMELVQVINEISIAGDPDSLIDLMHTHSYLLLKGSNMYQFIK